MDFRQLRISRRSIAIAAALVGMVSLAIGAHAALNKRALDAAKAVATEQSADAAKKASRIALVIGNGHYPDANAPLTQPINDARALTACAAPQRLRRRRGRRRQQGRHDPRRRPAEIQDQAGLRGDAVLRRLWHPGRPRELHDPGRCHDLEGSRRAPRRRQRSNPCSTR